MDITSLLTDFAFSKYESSCYLALLSQHPCNGSQLSKLSGIARSRIYDVLRSLARKGVVFEIEKGLFVPLPFEELKKRLQNQFESNLTLLENILVPGRLLPERGEPVEGRAESGHEHVHEGVEHLGFRRGITHGPPALVLLPLILAGLLYGYDRWQGSRGKRPADRLPVSFKWLFLLSFIGCLTHPALDWLNVYGIRLLEPFSSQWFYGDTLFIIDHQNG